jgi:hypothetical protein
MHVGNGFGSARAPMVWRSISDNPVTASSNGLKYSFVGGLPVTRQDLFMSSVLKKIQF